MKRVICADEKGWLHCWLLRDSDPESNAERGIPQDPPDLELIDWQEVKREIHNELVRQGLASWQDVQHCQALLWPALGRILRRHIVALFRRPEVAS